MLDYYVVFDMTLRNDTDDSKFRSVGFGRINPYDIIKQEHYNTSSSLYKENPLDVSYSLFPTPKPKDNKSYKTIVILVAVIFATLFMLGVAAYVYSICKHKKKMAAKNQLGEATAADNSQSFNRTQGNNHL